ncbi:S8 family serine peptidase [Burkholderia seminalis]|uniref:S8 family serine peptidase n=1 Tax=Burkholderia seminalis TaxID=488731 RepID=UPI0014535090|nr:S8 family serine peptidase [Burkholderia seminalis]MCA8434550.1 S8 family serine peptidase [Burkholderia seminalis]VWB91341.1 hypothetical protein BSE24067_04378 [Burkholderia seminalis]
MAADYPLLYVSNPSALQRDRKTTPGGKKTDFYADRDAAFAAHRASITNSIRTIQAQLGESSARFGLSGFVKVRLQEKAWAKSHRPVQRLFTRDTAPVVGGADIGELVVRADGAGLSRVIERIEAADANTKRRLDKHGDLVLNPNRERSELGALENLHLWSAADRRVPDAKHAVGRLNEQKLAPMYSVRFFEPISDALAKLQSMPAALRSADQPADTFVRSLAELSRSLGIYVVLENGLESISSAYIGLTESPGFAVLDGFAALSKVGEQLRVDGDYSLNAHRALLALLGEHPDIRTVAIPQSFVTDQRSPLVEAAVGQRIQRTSTVVSLLPAEIPEPVERVTYPTVAVVDGGIANTLGSWVKAVYGGIPENHRDLEHGTYIAGLLVGARELNPEYGARLEDDGCWLIDIALQTKDAFAGEYYENGSAKFLDSLDQVVGECRRNHPVRVFNFSLNNQTAVSQSDFSEEAIWLDEIARRHDVFFVISAGNAIGSDARPEWDDNLMNAAIQLIESRSDTLRGPADSLMNVSVGATNGQGVPNCIPDAPARYSRRGPGVRGSVKPDICHIGGADTTDVSGLTGLASVTEDGLVAAVKGTSMAVPLAAKTLAQLDLELGHEARREIVQAIFLHNTYFPAPLRTLKARRVGRGLVGFGYPRPSSETLILNRHTFGVVVCDNLKKDDNCVIDFRWPRELVDAEGRCRGIARLTLVYSPPLDFDYGAEAARISLVPSLRQREDETQPRDVSEDDEEEDEESEDATKVGWIGRINPVHSRGLKRTSRESALLLDGLKWSPVKVLEGSFRGIGRSAEWRMTVNYVARNQVEFPEDGVPFAAVLTITDPDGKANVYEDLKQELVANSATVLNDIRIALRVRSRTQR